VKVTLRDQVTKLAYDNPGEIRDALLPLLKTASVKLRKPTTDELREIRALARSIGSKHGIKPSVRSPSKGSVSDVVLVQTYPDPPTADYRIELIEALMKRGYDLMFADTSPTMNLQAQLNLAKNWDHTGIKLHLKKVV
jgi:hypothetical protein